MTNKKVQNKKPNYEKLSQELLELIERRDIPTDARMEILFIADQLSDNPLFNG